jgi:gamma-glutamyltranspeptidase/glutathione hydrolase
MSDRGAVAGGSPLTVEAGVWALREGGNAVDAAIAAQLMACVAEPLLTGMGGAGLAMVRFEGRVEMVDLFSTVPNLPAAQAPQPEAIEIDFGPTCQTFHVGPASVAAPALPSGLWAMHERYGRLPMSKLVEPAAHAAVQGVPVTAGFERVLKLLWPIQRQDERCKALFGAAVPAGAMPRPLREHELFYNPGLSRTLQQYGELGPRLFTEGAVAEAIIDELGVQGRLRASDLAAYQTRILEPISYRYRDATVWLPPAPSLAGMLVAQALRALEDHGPMPAHASARQMRFLSHALDRVDHTRRGPLRSRLFDSAFTEGFLTALSMDEIGEEAAHGRSWPRQPGNTTHISTVDRSGNSVSITTSLGETAGLVAGNTGVLLNNLLGEADVNPPDVALEAGGRLMTMCCPTLLELGNGIYAMGSGGSSRIRSAILHGIVYLTDHGLPPEEVVGAPRLHVEDGVAHVEVDGRSPATIQALRASPWQVRTFSGANMFFGGLHLVGQDFGRFTGAGDPRRSGAYGVA